jgi:hypothetical protein
MFADNARRTVLVVLGLEVIFITGALVLVALGPILSAASLVLVAIGQLAALLASMVTMAWLVRTSGPRGRQLRPRAARLLAASAFVLAAFGACFALVPSWSLVYWEALLRHTPKHADLAGEQIRFSYAILGLVIAGWMVLVGTLSHAGIAAERGDADACEAPWGAIAVSTALWFLLDTGVSLARGVGPNAISNVALVTPFALTLTALLAGRSRRRELTRDLTHRDGINHGRRKA